MRPGRGLRRRAPLKQGGGGGLRRSRLKPVSEKQRAKLAVEAAAVREHGAVFRAAIRGERCVVCGRTEREARDATGWGHEAHHGIRQETLRGLDLEELLWEPGNAIALCQEPCHRQHTSRKSRVPRANLPARFLAWIAALDVDHGVNLWHEVEKEYPA